MSRESLRDALFSVVEYLTQHALYDSGRSLVLYYFNESKESSSYERALSAIEKYFPESMPDTISPRLEKLLQELKLEADAWDIEE